MRGSQPQQSFILNNLSTIVQLLIIIESGIPYIFIEDVMRCEQIKLHTINNWPWPLIIKQILEIRIFGQNQQHFIVNAHVITEANDVFGTMIELKLQ